MGSLFSVYIGPYIEIVGEIIKDVEKVKRFCPNHPNMGIINEKYCPDCGTLIESRDYTENIKIPIDNFLYEFDKNFNNDLWIPYNLNHENTILLPNKKNPYDFKIKGSYDGGGVTELDNLDFISSKQIIWVWNEYKKYIEILRQNLGDDNVIVKWGYVGYGG